MIKQSLCFIGKLEVKHVVQLIFLWSWKLKGCCFCELVKNTL